MYGRSFTILTDHRPLLTLFGPQQPVPAHAAARLQRWALILASYNYKIEYRSTTAHADADSMSRLPLPQTWSPKCENIECFFLEPEVVTNVTSQMVKRETQVDPVLSKVYSYVISGWPRVVDPTLVPFKNKQDELTTQQGCVLWGTRVVVPPSLQEKVLHELHETHPGISRRKRYQGHMYGGPILMPTLKELFPHAVLVKLCDLHLLLLKSIHGFFQLGLGLAFMWTLQDRSLDICIWLLLMHTANSQRWSK